MPFSSRSLPAHASNRPFYPHAMVGMHVGTIPDPNPDPPPLSTASGDPRDDPAGTVRFPHGRPLLTVFRRARFRFAPGRHPAFAVARSTGGRLAEAPYADEDQAMPRTDGPGESDSQPSPFV